MRVNRTLSILLLCLAGTCAMAETANNAELQAMRKDVIRQYVLGLGKGDYEGLSALFVENGSVISTSRGKVNAREFFYNFLPEIVSAETGIHKCFVSRDDSNSYATRFRFAFKLRDGEVGDGEYIDEFVFADNSEKLSTVYMFENLEFNKKSESNSGQ